MDRRRVAAHAERRRELGKVAGGQAPPKTEAELAEALFKMGAACSECNGAGWIITLIEAMRGEWGCTLEEAVFSESINAALVLWPAVLARHGAEITVNHADKARQKAKAEAMAQIRQRFTIVPTPKGKRRK